jgi:endonuclease III
VTDDRLLQEILVEQDPTGWRMLVGCILLNLTSRKQVDEVWPALFERYPDAAHMRAEGPELAQLLYPLGLYNRRATALRRFSTWWIEAARQTQVNERMLALEPPGIGEYARDSWRIFKMGEDLDPDEVSDKELRLYLQRTREDNRTDLDR